MRDRSLAVVLAAALFCFTAALLTATFVPTRELSPPGAKPDTSSLAAAFFACADDGDGTNPTKVAEIGEGVTDAPDGSAPPAVPTTLCRADVSRIRHAPLDRRPPCLDGPRRPPRLLDLIA